MAEGLSAAEVGKEISERRRCASPNAASGPGFKVAFDAWRKTDSETNPNPPKGPTYMPQYLEPGLGRAAALDRQADESFTETTHFPLPGVRYGLIALGVVLLVISLVQLSQLPLPPR